MNHLGLKFANEMFSLKVREIAQTERERNINHTHTFVPDIKVLTFTLLGVNWCAAIIPAVMRRALISHAYAASTSEDEKR